MPPAPTASVAADGERGFDEGTECDDSRGHGVSRDDVGSHPAVGSTEGLAGPLKATSSSSGLRPRDERRGMNCVEALEVAPLRRPAPCDSEAEPRVAGRLYRDG